MVRRAAVVVLLCLALSLGVALPGRAQDTLPDRVEVFLARQPDTTAARLYFMDPLSGLSTVVGVEDGRNFAVVGDYVIYEKSRAGAVMRARPDGSIEPHPFIRRAADTASLHWVTSSDHQAIAWVRVSTAGESQAYVAWADGSDLQELPIPSPVPPYSLRLLALTDGRTQLLYDLQQVPGGPPDLPFVTFADVGEYHIREQTVYPMAAEPLCPCPAAITADGRLFARLQAPEGEGPFVLRIWDLPTQAEFRVAAPALPYRMAGDLLLSGSGTLAIYAVAAGVGPEAGQFNEQYGLILVDAAAQTQRLIVGPSPVRYRPLKFMDGDSTVLAIGVNQPGTFKVDVATGALLRVSAEEHLGTIVVGQVMGLLVQ